MDRGTLSIACAGHRFACAPPGHDVVRTLYSKTLSSGEQWPCAENSQKYGMLSCHRHTSRDQSCMLSMCIFSEECCNIEIERKCVLCSISTFVPVVLYPGVNIVSFCKDNIGCAFARLCLDQSVLSKSYLFEYGKLFPAPIYIPMFSLFKDIYPKSFVVLRRRTVLRLESICRFRLGEEILAKSVVPRSLKQVTHSWVGYKYAALE